MQVICVDKTGTLTTNAMTVERIAIPSALSQLCEFKVDPNVRPGYQGAGHAIREFSTHSPVERPADVAGLRLAATAGAVCNDATLSVDESTGKITHVGESMDAALCVLAEHVGMHSMPEPAPAVRCLPSTCRDMWRVS
jgi:magnesium-transporting ATPase (P-type)